MKLTKLKNAVKDLSDTRGYLDNYLESIKSQQSELDQMLNDLEAEVDRLEKDKMSQKTPADARREESLKKTTAINDNLNFMEGSLKELGKCFIVLS